MFWQSDYDNNDIRSNAWHLNDIYEYIFKYKVSNWSYIYKTKEKGLRQWQGNK